MTNKIAIIVTGEKANEVGVQSALQSIPGLELKKEQQQRGVLSGAMTVAKWIASLVGSTDKVADILIQEATRHAVGASIELQFGTTVIKVSNANRSQIMELLDKAAAIGAQNQKPPSKE